MNFSSPFFGADQRTRSAAEKLGIELVVELVGQDYMDKVLRNPVYGYGKNMNPCIDCHAFMFRSAGRRMEELGASFIITGEVLGQRPMSQNRSALGAVDKLSGYRGYIVRPLSGRLLPPTIPEQEGWIKRDMLLDLSGRGRTRQMELARELGVEDYPSPAGGCLLTEPNFSQRLRHIMKLMDQPCSDDIDILKVGRHFYLQEGLLLVVGRNQSENERLEVIARPGDQLLKVTDRPGPTGLIRSFSPIDIDMHLEHAASIVSRYSDAKNEPIAKVKVYSNTGELTKLLDIKPLSPEEVPAMV